MTKLLQSLLLLLASGTDKDRLRQIQFLKEENRILRDRLPKRIQVTPTERQRLLKFGKPLGSAIRHLITIVSPRTFLRWLHGETRPKEAASKRGRKRTPEEVRELVLRLARENDWGYTRILGELKKLGIKKISRATVVNILKENGLDPGPKRGEGTWFDFIKRHKESLIACDFFSTKVWTMSGVVEYFVLFFIHVGTRKVYVAGMTPNPNAPWVIQQARNAAMHFGEEPAKPRYLLRDHDSKFVPEFDAVLEAEGMEVVPTSVQAPNMNAVAERFVQTVKGECLDHFIVFGEAHLRYLLKQFLIHYHECRPHQGLGNMPLGGLPAVPEDKPLILSEVRCEERLGGLLKHYSRAA
ncbi:MAG: hypothetical protein KatS3mg109_2179 [Pirellulaceae bacterium]|jgi:putative transposase|uniref:Transposase n=1 Tax=Thermogemmata fonticola TaxID=2755323 RepID=A0A7V9AA55_9BACT|nr:integrase core domain-containing protein [Thermogemmata fonticola]MBA2224559.1 transposase [Thermogemmata fonticola]GIW91747.1 MAG: hypothetical protein KatS3mg109_2179 [Pirellulaceae bacterium]